MATRVAKNCDLVRHRTAAIKSMKVLHQQEEYLRENVRDALALDPLITIRRLQKIIEHNTGRTISDKYLMRLLGKVRRQIIFESDRKKVSARIAEVRERYATLQKHLYHIIYWMPQYRPKYGIREPKVSERINAIRTVAQMDLELLKAELDVGAYENRQAALTEMLREGLLPQELQEQVVGVFRAWKLRPSPVQTEVTRDCRIVALTQ